MLEKVLEDLQLLHTKMAVITNSGETMPLIYQRVSDVTSLSASENSMQDGQMYAALVSDVSSLNNVLQIGRLKTMNGHSVKDSVKRMMSFLMTDRLAQLLNWTGAHGKLQCSQLKIISAAKGNPIHQFPIRTFRSHSILEYIQH